MTRLTRNIPTYVEYGHTNIGPVWLTIVPGEYVFVVSSDWGTLARKIGKNFNGVSVYWSTILSLLEIPEYTGTGLDDYETYRKEAIRNFTERGWEHNEEVKEKERAIGLYCPGRRIWSDVYITGSCGNLSKMSPEEIRKRSHRYCNGKMEIRE